MGLDQFAYACDEHGTRVSEIDAENRWLLDRIVHHAAQ